MKEELKAYSQKTKEWWLTLQPREKQIVGIGGTVVSFLLFYVLIWSPILTHLETMRKRIVSDSKTLQWMEVANTKMNQLSAETANQTQTLSPVALLAVLQKQVGQHGLTQALVQLKQASNDSIDLEFKQVNFDHFIKFLVAVLKENRVTVAQLSVKADETIGTTDITLTLKL